MTFSVMKLSIMTSSKVIFSIMKFSTLAFSTMAFSTLAFGSIKKYRKHGITTFVLVTLSTLSKTMTLSISGI